MIAATASTIRTKRPAMRSANCTIGGRLRLCCSTNCIKRPTRVASPTASTRTTSRVERLTVPAFTALPGPTAVGCDSPVSKARLTDDSPSSTLPSAGIESPAADLDQVARPHGLDRHLDDRTVLQPPRRGGRERKEQFQRVVGPALLPPLQPAADEQQEHEHAERVEVDFAAAQDGVDRARDAAGGQPDGDGQIEMGRPRAQRGPRAAEEEAARPSRAKSCRRACSPSGRGMRIGPRCR